MLVEHVSPLACFKESDLRVLTVPIWVALSAAIACTFACAVCNWQDGRKALTAWYLRPSNLEVLLEGSVHCGILAPAVLTFLQGCEWVGQARVWTGLWIVASFVHAYAVALLLHQVRHGSRPAIRWAAGWRLRWYDCIAGNPVTLEVAQLAMLQLAFVLPAAYLVHQRESGELVRSLVAGVGLVGFLWASARLAAAKLAAEHSLPHP